MAEKPAEIALGRRFVPTGDRLFNTRQPEWEVVAIFTGSDGLDYAQIRRVGPPQDAKTVSGAVLSDRRHYLALA
jgi:hypothetical protein